MCPPVPGRCGALGHRPSLAVRSRCARRRRGAHRATIGRAREAPTAGGPCVRRMPGLHGGAEGTRRLDRRTWRARSPTALRRTAARGLGWSISSARPRWQRRHGRRNEGRGQAGEGSGVACVHAVRAGSASGRSIILRPALVDNSNRLAIVAEVSSSRQIRSVPPGTAEGTFPVPHAETARGSRTERRARCGTCRGPDSRSHGVARRRRPARGITKVPREARKGALSIPHQVTDRTRDQEGAAGSAQGSVIDPAPSDRPDAGSERCCGKRAGERYRSRRAEGTERGSNRTRDRPDAGSERRRPGLVGERYRSRDGTPPSRDATHAPATSSSVCARPAAESFGSAS